MGSSVSWSQLKLLLAYPQALNAVLEHHDAHAIPAHVGADVPAHADAQPQRDGVVEQEAKEVRVERRQARR